MKAEKIIYKWVFAAMIIAVSLLSTAFCQLPVANQYVLRINYTDKDSAFNPLTLQLKTSFINRQECATYINKLPATLATKGYPAASVDSVKYDSNFALIKLYLGVQQQWTALNTDAIDKKVLDEIGFSARSFTNKPVNIQQLQSLQQRLLDYYENNGFPFAAVYLDSVRLAANRMEALLKVNKGPLYHIDSIRVYGQVKIANSFLQRYLDISNGSIYSKAKLQEVSKLMQELPYLQELQASDITMLGTGSVLNLYLQTKKSSQVNFLVGFLPANNQTNKLQLTGDVNLNLKNALGAGETILLNWQQLQIKSPKLNIGYQHPYIFKSQFGIDLSFDLFKKDSTFLQINAQAGLQYLLSARQSGKLFIQKQNTFLLASGVDTAQVIATKKLPANVDVNTVSLGVDYEWNNTNYKFNPRKGNELKLVTSVGLKNITKNSDILNIKDPSFNYGSLYDSIKLRTYQFRVKLAVAHFFPSGKQSTLKVGLNSAVFSSPNIFRNELFQIGGYKLLRGFDEESIYATQYAVTTAEYRFLVGLNSYFFGFTDAGWVKNKYQDIRQENFFLGAGIGLVFETKLGLLNISYAIGKRDDVKLDLRQSSKIHFGYINYF